MEEEKKEKKNTVLEIQNGFIDVREIFKRSKTTTVQDVKEKENGKVSA